jgi:hypothetical protein
MPILYRLRTHTPRLYLYTAPAREGREREGKRERERGKRKEGKKEG